MSFISNLIHDPIHAKYIKYTNYVNKITQNGDMSIFKSIPDYKYMLEHVDYKLGLKYLIKLLSLGISVKDIEDFAKINDSIGSPTKYKYPHILIPISPSNLRYIYQAHLILSHFRTHGSHINIVEIGGGYGGLYLAINHFYKRFGMTIDSYSIIDLPEIIKFQQLYLSKFNAITTIPLQLYSAYEFGANMPKSPNLCLISSYCFSEISLDFQSNYINNVFPYIEKAFIAWNCIPFYGINGMDAVVTPYLDESNPYTYYVYLTKSASQ
jgi:hypothetical protein